MKNVLVLIYMKVLSLFIRYDEEHKTKCPAIFNKKKTNRNSGTLNQTCFINIMIILCIQYSILIVNWLTSVTVYKTLAFTNRIRDKTDFYKSGTRHDGT